MNGVDESTKVRVLAETMKKYYIVYIPVIVGTIISWLGTTAITDQQLTTVISAFFGLIATVMAIIFYKLQARRKKDIVRLTDRTVKNENDMIAMAKSHVMTSELLLADSEARDKRTRSDFTATIEAYSTEANNLRKELIKQKREEIDRLNRMSVIKNE